MSDSIRDDEQPVYMLAMKDGEVVSIPYTGGSEQVMINFGPNPTWSYDDEDPDEVKE